MWSASFETILVFSGATMALNTLFSVLGLFILRSKQSTAPEFVQPLYPFPAIIFSAITGATLIFLSLERPSQIMVSIAIIITGGILYWLLQGKSGGKTLPRS